MADNDEGDLRGYLVTFLRHLKDEEEARNEFLEFYPGWRRMRNENIATLAVTRNDLHETEDACNIGEVVTRTIGAGGSAVALGSLSVCPPLAVGAGVVSLVGHLAAVPFTMARNEAVSSSRRELGRIVDRDYDSTRNLVRLGLRHLGFLNDMRATMQNIRRATLSYTVGKIAEQFRNLTAADCAHPRQAAQILVAVFENGNLDGVQNAISVLRNYFRQNPDVPRASLTALQAGFDLHSLSGLVQMHSMWSVNLFDVLYGFSAFLSLAFDAAAIGRCIHDIRSGTSVTQEAILEVRRRLIEERYLVDGVHTRLRDFLGRRGHH